MKNLNLKNICINIFMGIIYCKWTLKQYFWFYCNYEQYFIKWLQSNASMRWSIGFDSGEIKLNTHVFQNEALTSRASLICFWVSMTGVSALDSGRFRWFHCWMRGISFEDGPLTSTVLLSDDSPAAEGKVDIFHGSKHISSWIKIIIMN